MRRKLITALTAAALTALCSPAASWAVAIWTTHHGTTQLILDEALLAKLGLTVEALTDDDQLPQGRGQLTLDIAPDEIPIVMKLDGGMPVGFAEGVIRHATALRFTVDGRSIDVAELAIPVGEFGAGYSGLVVTATNVNFDRHANTIALASDDVSISEKLAEELGHGDWAGTVIGSIQSSAHLAFSGGEYPAEESNDEPGPRACASPRVGPDVIVGDIHQSSSWTNVGAIDSFSWGSVSCNLGNVPLSWVAGTNQHPVIPQSMYRYKVVNGAGRMEQIGISWCKHGFTALTNNTCCPCTNPGTGSLLGVGCADPYSAPRNGTQLTTTGGLGPRFDINAHTGGYTFPYPFRNTNGAVAVTSITRRIQVKTSDLNPLLNSGASYYAEDQYVTPDDASYNTGSGWVHNQNNNSSYRPITISGSDPNYSATLTGSTNREKAAIQAWKLVHDAGVTETLVDTPEAEVPVGSGNTTGRVILSAKATNLGGGVYHYEYAVYNMNSDRSIKSFSIPVQDGLTVSNIEFHDVDFHSGDGFGSTPTVQVTYDGTDWPGVYSGGAVTWTMVNASPVGNSNALRWGTMYNFRFDVNASPVNCSATLGLFKAVVGLPDTVSAATVVPCTPPAITPPADASTLCGIPFIGGAQTAAPSCPTIIWSLGDGAPDGMLIQPITGAVTWPLPLISGSPYTINVVATTSCGVDTKSFQLTVNPNPPSVDPIADSFAVCGQDYSAPASASGGAAPYVWSLVGSPPAGVTVDPDTGVVSWPSPTAVGSPHTITVHVESAGDCGGNDESFDISVVIGDFNADGLITLIDLPLFVDALIGVTPPICAGDLNGDGFVNGDDVQLMVVNFP